jgi:hypothetical protein
VKVVTPLGDYFPEMPGVVAPEPVPAMPVREQRGRRAPAKKAGAGLKTGTQEKVEG